MNRLLLPLAVLVVLVVVVVAEEPKDYDDSDVLKLTTANFDQAIQSEFIVVKFFAPWCGHCKHLAPEYAQAATILKDEFPPIKLAEVDATAETELASKYEIHGYPTLKIFKNGVELPYNGPRDASGIVKYLRGQNGPAAKPLNTRMEYEAFIAKKMDVVIVGFFTNQASKDTFNKVAETMREDYTFAIVTDADLMSTTNVGKEGVINVRPWDGEEQIVTYTGDLTDAIALKEFIKSTSLPIAGILKDSNQNRYEAAGIPRLTLFAKIDESKDPSGIKYYLNRLRKAAEGFKGKMYFALADKSNEDFTSLNFGEANIGMAIIDGAAKYKSPSTEFSIDIAKAFATQFLAGSLEKYVKSQPIPENNDGPVQVVVGKTFEKEVTNSDVDVFIKFYAPWCGHCKALAPIWEDLAKGNTVMYCLYLIIQDLKKSKTVKIVEMDATENEVPPQFNIQGFPTIYLVKANDKRHPIVYDGEREVAAFEDFLQTHGSIEKKDKKDKKDKKEKKEKKDKKEKKEEQKEL